MFLLDIIQRIFGKKSQFILTDEYKQALELFEHTNKSVFISGKAGTGKSTLIRYMLTHTKKKVVLLAPTGIAALNIRGQTIHSFFKFPPRVIDCEAIPKTITDQIYANIETIIIDEISMVRADIMDGIDLFLRRFGKNKNVPFGGVQMILVGDLYQLPPVVTSEEERLKMYPSPYFFDARVFKNYAFKTVELQTCFRQRNQKFVDILNTIREGSISQETLQVINNRVDKSEKPPKEAVVLCTTNKVADSINQLRLDAIKKPLYTYEAIIEDDFPTKHTTLPVVMKLSLKIGARVLFLKNDKGGRFVNGSMGIVQELKPDTIRIKLLDTHRVITVEKVTWENIRYELDEKSGEIRPNVIGTLTQYPLKLAWGITIHKSQGMSFDNVAIDLTRAPFAHGQMYVALSRCRSLEGLTLSREVRTVDVIIDKKVTDFYKKISQEFHTT